MADTIEYYNTIAQLLDNDGDHYYNGALLVDLDSDPSTFIDQDVDNIIRLSDLGRRVLECGCGGGYFFKRLKKKKRNMSYYGIDISEEQIKRAKEVNPKYEDRFQVASWDNIPFEDNYFDTILFLETVGYAENVDRMIEECYRVLKPGGTLFVKHPGSTLPGVMSELDSKVDYQKVLDITKDSMMKADVERYTQYLKIV
jgi:ubiquinone/menaquinone biosynthesis C-methylase UbiE